VGRITEEARRVVDEQQLGFWATVCPDGSPNLSPKGTTRVFDGGHLFFADICSPQTVANVRAGSLVEVNVVDPFLRKGYRFKGPAEVHEPPSSVFAEAVERLREGGSALTGRVRAVVLLRVDSVAPLVSPAYDDGTSEDEVLASHRARFDRLLAGRGQR
jgi:uncharacterized protein